VLVVRSTRVTEAMLEAPDLSLVVRAGAGVNTIDVAAAARRGIYVSNCPGRNASAVAELAIGLLLALDRRIPDNVADLRAGRWNKKEYAKARGLYGRMLGLLGFGSISTSPSSTRPRRWPPGAMRSACTWRSRRRRRPSSARPSSAG
jgi:D-3-phosphoglycerate dehydrogenase